MHKIVTLNVLVVLYHYLYCSSLYGLGYAQIDGSISYLTDNKANHLKIACSCKAITIGNINCLHILL